MQSMNEKDNKEQKKNPLISEDKVVAWIYLIIIISVFRIKYIQYFY